MDLITRKNFKNVEPGLMMNLKTDGKNIITEFEINKSNLRNSSKQNVKQKNQKIIIDTKKITKYVSKKNHNKKSNISTVNNNKNTNINTINKLSQDDIIKKRERNKYAARRSRERKRLINEELCKKIEVKNNYIQKLETQLKDIDTSINIFKMFIEELKKDN